MAHPIEILTGDLPNPTRRAEIRAILDAVPTESSYPRHMWSTEYIMNAATWRATTLQVTIPVAGIEAAYDREVYSAVASNVTAFLRTTIRRSRQEIVADIMARRIQQLNQAVIHLKRQQDALSQRIGVLELLAAPKSLPIPDIDWTVVKQVVEQSLSVLELDAQVDVDADRQTVHIAVSEDHEDALADRTFDLLKVLARELDPVTYKAVTFDFDVV